MVVDVVNAFDCVLNLLLVFDERNILNRCSVEVETTYRLTIVVINED